MAEMGTLNNNNNNSSLGNNNRTIAVDRREHDVSKTPLGDGVGCVGWLTGVRRRRAAICLDAAEPTASRAFIAENLRSSIEYITSHVKAWRG